MIDRSVIAFLLSTVAILINDPGMAELAPGLPEFEVPQHIHANLGASVPETPPGEWVEILRLQSGAIRRVSIGWRRGAGPYVPIPGASIEIGELLKEPPAKKNGDATKVDAALDDQRLTDPGKWALDVATGRWRAGIEWAKKNGPVIDVQLQCWAIDPKKNVLGIIKGAISAKRINLTGEGGGYLDGPAPGTTEYMNLALLSALLKSYENQNNAWDGVAKTFVSIGGVMQTTIGITEGAIKLKDSAATGQDNARQGDRDFYLELAKLKMTGDGIDKAITELAPIAKTFAENWRPGGALKSVSKIAGQLMASLNKDQKEKFESAGIGELFQDLLTALEKLVECKDDQAAAQNIITAILPALERSQKLIGGILEKEQRDLMVGLIEAAGLVTKG